MTMTKDKKKRSGYRERARWACVNQRCDCTSGRRPSVLECTSGIRANARGEGANELFAELYDAGPTSCIAHPSILRSIRGEIRRSRVLSTADARIAQRLGMLRTPSVGRIGWNDGVIYPPRAEAVRGAARRARPTGLVGPAKVTGTLRCLVLLVDFEDNPGSRPSSDYEKLLFDREDPASMTSFYRDLSYGKLTVEGTVTDWIRAPRPYSAYTAGQSGTGNTFPDNTPGLLADVLEIWSRSNSLSSYDANRDGFIDGLALVHAGAGAETEADPQKRTEMIWSHKWVLPQPFEQGGVTAFAYFTAPEDGRLGVFAHEFGHFLGLPDLYDASYRSRGIGEWCLMAGGSWNGGGNTPARMSAWCLARLGWIRPNVVSGRKALRLESLEQDAGACHRLWTGGASGTEYFLIENRQRAGRDRALPGSGLLLWHVDESQSDNTSPTAYLVGLVQADGANDLESNRNAGDAGDPFPGRTSRTAVSDTQNAEPNTRATNGARTGVTLSGIREQGGVVAVTVRV